MNPSELYSQIIEANTYVTELRDQARAAQDFLQTLDAYPAHAANYDQVEQALQVARSALLQAGKLLVDLDDLGVLESE